MHKGRVEKIEGAGRSLVKEVNWSTSWCVKEQLIAYYRVLSPSNFSLHVLAAHKKLLHAVQEGAVLAPVGHPSLH